MFGPLLVRARTATVDLPVHADFGGKHLLVFRTFLAHNLVFRRRVQLGALRVLQQFALEIHEVVGHDDFLDPREVEAVQDSPDLFEPAIQVDRPEHRFVGIGQDTFLAPTAHLGFGLAHLDVLAQVPFLRGLGASMARYNGALALGKVALRIVGERPVQVLGREHVEHGIPQELQALVVVRVGHILPGKEGPVYQGVGQQFRIAEPVPELRLKPVTGLLAKPEL